MDSSNLLVLAVLAVTVVFLVVDVVRIDVVAIVCMLALGWTGVLSPGEVFSGFSSNAVMAMMGVMILGQGIAGTGIMDLFSAAEIRKAGTDRRKIIGLMSLSVGPLSGFVQNIGAAALFLPGILDISRREKIPPSALIMPIGFAAILGGTLTMIGSGPLILINDLIRNFGLEPYTFFSVTPVGVPLLIAGIMTGAGIFAALYPRLNEGILKWGYFGKVTLPQVFKVSDRAVVIPVAVIIVLTLFLMEVAGL